MIKTFKKILNLLLLQGEKQFYWLVLAVVVMAVLDMIGVASIFPFLNVIADPDVIQENSKLKWVYDKFNFTSKDSFLVSLGILSFSILIINNVLRLKISIAVIRFTWLKRYILSKELLAKYLYEPYVFFLNRNTSELTTYLVSEIARVVSSVLIPCMQIFAKSLTALLIFGLLVVVNPVVAIVIVVAIGGGYAIVYIFARKTLSRLGEDTTKYSKSIYKNINEAFGGIKDIKLLGKENVFLENFSDPVKKMGDCFCSQYIIFQFPRYVLEVLVFGGVLFAAIYIAVVQQNYHQVIPVVGLYAFAAYRLMPALQQIYQDVSSIRSALPALEVVYQDFMDCSGGKTGKGVHSSQRLSFSNKIELRNVTFQYPKAQGNVIENFNLVFEKNTVVGLVGGSGAGKTTLMDIFLGLLRPKASFSFIAHE